MKTQNIILTSMLALVIATPAVAEVGDTVNAENPAMCTVGDLGVSSGTANATAQYSINSYTCAAGTYLPAGNGWSTDTQYTDNNCAACTAGNYCVGSASSSDATNGKYQYSPTATKGLQSCPSGYPSSAANASSANDCYRACTTGDVPHSATVTGNFYSNETAQSNSCVPATCVTGYSVQSFDPSTVLPAILAGPTGYRYKALNDPDGDSADYDEGGTGLSDLANGEWEAKWESGSKTGKLRGIASCNDTPGTYAETTAPSNTMNSSNTGEYCWCKPTSWTASGGTTTELSAAWVFSDDYGDASNCASLCAISCADDVYGSGAFRSALFGVVGASSPQCVANNITLSWNNENGTQFTSGSCTYDESLTVPSTHPDKRGYTFTGWKFVSPSQN